MSTSDQRCPVYEQQPATAVPRDVQSQPVFPPPVQTPSPWSTGLFGCSNCLLYCVSCWLPCLTFGQIVEIVDEGSTSCTTHAILYAIVMYMTGCSCVYSGYYRAKIRKQYGLEESPCNDFCTHWCCLPCALRQEYRELENRGFDVSIGWNQNIQRKTREEQLVQSAPTTQGGMHH